MTTKQREAIAPGVYAKLVSLIAERGEAVGYAIAVHGSLRRDLDLIAVPWTDDAVAASDLVEAVRSAVGGYVVPDGTLGGRWDADSGKFVEAAVENPAAKPHGRLAWAINLGGGAYIDLSVMPIVKSE